MPTPKEILTRYWGYDDFRPLQLDIIDSVLEGVDTLGLLPTGGGKSLTFQVPALILPHVTLVVTPLISLMKDQVDALRQRGIAAAAIHSGMTRREQNLSLERAELGKIKMLYLSPEKLQSDAFVERLNYIKVSLIVVDEAHCISQWGYDFRPSYLKIAAVRKIYPSVPVLALTASATPDVALDIGKKLGFRDGRKFSRSFSRPNISYIVRYDEVKDATLLRVLKSTSGSAIVYVRSRRRTREIAAMLCSEGISAGYYHAGLDPSEKNERQNSWKAGDTRVMVATNAFGMGIDKPDVRVVVHMDLPSSLEEYYQEAGRAGRDGMHSFAVVIASVRDKATLTRRLEDAFPPKDFIRRVYELACNFVDVAVGGGYGQVFDFNFDLFCERFSLNPRRTRSAMAILTRAGYFDYADEVSTHSRVMVIASKNELYGLALDDVTDCVFQLMLRTYPGLFADYVYISEWQMASLTGLTEQQIYESLLKLGRLHAVHYVPRKTSPFLFFPTSRELPKHVAIPKRVYEDMRERMRVRLDAMRCFVFTADKCRATLLLNYFGETPAKDCAMCDVCRSRRKRPGVDRAVAERVRAAVVYLASHPGGTTLYYAAEQLGMDASVILPEVRRMADEGEIAIVSDGATVRIKRNDSHAKA